MINLNAVQTHTLEVIHASIAHSQTMLSTVAPAGFMDYRGIRDYCRIGFNLPQRSGSSVLSQYLIDDLSAKNPDAKILWLANNFDFFGTHTEENNNVSVFQMNDAAGYGRLISLLGDSNVVYNYVIVDNANYVCGRDVHFDKLAKAIFHQDASQYIITFSS